MLPQRGITQQKAALLKPNTVMWIQLALFSALFSIAISQQQSPHRQGGVHEASLSTHGASVQANRVVRQLADFSWGIAPREGFPIIAFNARTVKSEVEFMYDYTGTLTDSKNISMSLFQNDCLTPADSSLAFAADYGTPGELSVAIDIIQETIADSVHYSQANSSTATIAFCVRADYMFESDSMNFYETNVTINVDETAGFTLNTNE
jgi:hypothetical protein